MKEGVNTSMLLLFNKIVTKTFSCREDVKLIASLGVTHYRFSIDWSRVMKNGVTRNPAGMEYYKDLCRELKKEGIQCIVCLIEV